MNDDILNELSTKATFRFLTEYLAQTLIAGAGAIIGGLAIAAIPAVGIPFLAGTLRQQTGFPLLKVADEPYFLLPIALALVFGFWQQKRFESSAAYFLSVVPGLVLLSTFLAWQSYTARGRWENAWANLFTSDCSESGCLYQYVVTAPFYTTLAYTSGWIVAKRRRTDRHCEAPRVES